MSSPETPHLACPPPAAPRRMLLALALVAAAFAGGCLQPLYAENTLSSTGGSIRTALKSVEVPEIKGLVGHYLRNELVFELDGGGDADSLKTLKLGATVSESIDVVTVDFTNARADSAVLVATATWTLEDVRTGKSVARGSNTVREPYERSSQRFASVRAARDAQVRAGKSLATLMRGEISASLAASR